MIIHIVPILDVCSHNEQTTCDCHPSVEFTEDGDMIVIHNAFDGRD
jgi:hypothetical protein